MAPHSAPDRSLDDVQVMGAWNFTMQGDTPLYWLRTGQLDRYLLKFRIAVPNPCTAGFVLHAEVDGPGTDGASFWIDRRPAREGRDATRRYCLAGDGLDSAPIATRAFPDSGVEHSEEVELMMEGYNGTIMLQERKVVLRFRMKHTKGSVGFYNTTRGDVDEAHFSGVRITALRRGPLEVDGKFLARERNLERFDQDGPGQSGAVLEEASPAKRRPVGQTVSTMAPSMDSQTRSLAAPSTFGGRTVTDFRSTSTPLAAAGSSQVQPGPSQLSSSPAGSPMRMTMDVGGRGKAMPKGRLQSSASEGSLRKTSGSLRGGPGGAGFGECSPTPSGARRRQRKAPDQWVPLALNAPAGEQALLKSVPRKQKVPNSACTDFIPM